MKDSLLVATYTRKDKEGLWSMALYRITAPWWNTVSSLWITGPTGERELTRHLTWVAEWSTGYSNEAPVLLTWKTLNVMLASRSVNTWSWISVLGIACVAHILTRPHMHMPIKLLANNYSRPKQRECGNWMEVRQSGSHLTSNKGPPTAQGFTMRSEYLLQDKTQYLISTFLLTSNIRPVSVHW